MVTGITGGFYQHRKSEKRKTKKRRTSSDFTPSVGQALEEMDDTDTSSSDKGSESEIPFLDDIHNPVIEDMPNHQPLTLPDKEESQSDAIIRLLTPSAETKIQIMHLTQMHNLLMTIEDPHKTEDIVNLLFSASIKPNPIKVQDILLKTLIHMLKQRHINQDSQKKAMLGLLNLIQNTLISLKSLKEAKKDLNLITSCDLFYTECLKSISSLDNVIVNVISLNLFKKTLRTIKAAAKTTQLQGASQALGILHSITSICASSPPSQKHLLYILSTLIEVQEHYIFRLNQLKNKHVSSIVNKKDVHITIHDDLETLKKDIRAIEVSLKNDY